MGIDATPGALALSGREVLEAELMSGTRFDWHADT